ncbi:MAG: hypothetical protein FJY55_16425, partial [Betaproteobacteria bacterium]|nr:hypothetical protein [Betaproteobacteria bacterium]
MRAGLPGRFATCWWRPLLSVASALAVLAGCSPADSGHGLQGYVEGEFVLAAAPAGGTLARLQVKRGDSIGAGSPL